MCALSITWKIRNFPFYHLKIFSPTFSAENMEGTKWRLFFEVGRVYLARKEVDDCPRKIKVEGKLFYITEDGSEKSFVFKTEFDKNEDYKVCELPWIETLFETLTIHCSLSLSSDLSPLVKYVAHTDCPVEKYLIVRNVLLPFCGDQEVQSHPIYLYAISQYFSGFEILLKSTSVGIRVTVELKELKVPVIVKYKIKLMNMEERLLTAYEDIALLNMKRRCFSFQVNRKEETVDTWTTNIKIIAYFEVAPISTKYTSHIVSTTYPLITCHALPENTRADDVTSLNKIIKAMFVVKKFCDFTIRCHGREFLVHKSVLTAASPVFNAMLDVDMAEKQRSTIDIEDIEPDTVSKMIDFLYTDPMDELEWGSSVDLYFAANKYQIRDLTQNCARLMKNHLAVENVCEVLSISDMHQDADLMEAAKEFLRSHFKQVLQSNQWQSFMETNTKVACSMMYERCKLIK